MTHERTAATPPFVEGIYELWTRRRFYRRVHDGWESTKGDPRKELVTWEPCEAPKHGDAYRMFWTQKGERLGKRKTQAEKDATPLFDGEQPRGK